MEKKSKNKIQDESFEDKPFVCKTTRGWLVHPGSQRFRTLRDAKNWAAQYRRGLDKSHRHNTGCDEIAGGEIVRVECGWNIVAEVRPGHWTQLVGPYETREQARRVKREAVALRDLNAERAERCWREEVQKKQHQL
jgi:hypothetical protein